MNHDGREVKGINIDMSSLKDHWDKRWKRVSYSNNSIIKLIDEKSTTECWRIYLQLLEEIALQEPKILELGSGSGRMSIQLLKKFGGSATLVDYSLPAIEVAKSNAIKAGVDKNVEFVNGDVFTLDRKREYDLVHSAGLIEHFSSERRDEIIRKHSSFACMEGYVIIMVPTKTWWYSIGRSILQSIGIWPQDFEVPLNGNELTELANRNLLTVKKTIESKGLARASAIIASPIII